MYDSSLIVDINIIEQRIDYSDKKIQNAEKNLTEQTEEINDYNDTNLADIKQTVKEYKAYMRAYSSSGHTNIVDLIRTTLIDWNERTIKSLHKVNLLANSLNAKVLYFRMKSDYIRYLAELYENQPDQYQNNIQEALVTYYTGMELAKDLPINNVNRLGMTLNYCVLLSDEVRDVEKSINILNSILSEIKPYLAKGSEVENYEPCKLIADIMEENLKYYEENKAYYIDQKPK